MQSKEELISIFMSKGIDQDTAHTWAYYLQQLPSCSLHSADIQVADEEAWLAARTHGIGGSDIASILGESSWKSAYDIWMSKTGQLPSPNTGAEHLQSEPARWGNLLEDTIAYEWARRNNKQIIKIPVSLKSNEHPYMLANIDGFVLSDDRKTITGILEIKTTSAYNKELWEVGPVPYYYICQATWYTMITDLPGFDIVCLVGGQHLFSYYFPKDPELCERMKAAADKFWNINVRQLIAPDFQAVDAQRVTEAEISDDCADKPTIDNSDKTDNAIQAYLELNEKIRALENIKKELYAKIFQAMHSKPTMVTRSNTVKLSRSTRRTCDMDVLQRDFPEAYDATVTAKTSNRLVIS